MLKDDLLIRQIRAFTAALLRIKSQKQMEPADILDDLGELFDELFGLKAKIALGLDAAALVRLLSPAGVFDKDRGRALVALLRLQAQAAEDLGHQAAARRHRAQIEALCCAGDFDADAGSVEAASVGPADLANPS